MNNDPLTDVVARQYEQWSYPPPISDLKEWVKNKWEWFDPSHTHRILWPGREHKPHLKILSAGCGTNQAAVFAYTNPAAQVVGVDISEQSLAHQQSLKEKHGLHNLELHRLPIEELPALGLDFDLIVSTGVLHHMADPTKGIKALAGCLRQDGVLALMLYAKYGRIGVELLQSVFKDMGLRQDDASVATVRDAISSLSREHYVQSYLQMESKTLPHDAVIVDTFLHGRDRSYTVDDCLELVSSAGLEFQGWLFNAPYYVHDFLAGTSEFYAAVNQLPERKMWSVMERISTTNACHSFMACHPERAKASYSIDFSTSEWLEYLPSMRMNCGITRSKIFRPDWSMTLDQTQHALVRSVDGNRTIREIISRTSESEECPVADVADLEKIACKLFQSLWRLDFLAMGLTLDGDL